MASTQAHSDPIAAVTRSPELFPHAQGEVELVETHISWVFLCGDRAYKLRKPVVFPFLDYGTAERRYWMAEEEVRLGRRLAPDVYLGMRSLVEHNGRLELAEPGAAGALEHVVEMRRFDERQTLAARLADGTVSPDDVRRVAEYIADFHAAAAPVAPSSSDSRAVAATVGENFSTLLPHARMLGPVRLAAAHRFATAFVHGRRELLDARAARGEVRDGHGDLRAEHVLLGDEGVAIVDPLEFDPTLRGVDVLADLAFLVMDLVAADREDLAEVLIDEYRIHATTEVDEELLWFYASYRAWVRAKVECLRAEELEVCAERATHLDIAQTLAAVAVRLTWRARCPLVLVICGGSATGKTQLAKALARTSGLPHLNSDVVRKELHGLGPHERAPASAYTEEESLRTYLELGLRAAGAPDGAIVDATFRHETHRAAFLDGYAGRAPAPLFVECRAPAATVLERAHQREQDPTRVSDATPELAESMLAEFEPLDEVPAYDHFTLRGDLPVAEAIDDLEAFLDGRLARCSACFRRSRSVVHHDADG